MFKMLTTPSKMYSFKKLLQNSFLNFPRTASNRKYIPTLIPWTKDRYLLDKRQQGDREILDFKWKLNDGKDIRFEIADEFDLVLIAQQLIDGFVKEVNLCKALDIQFDELARSQFELVQNALPFRGTLLGFYENKLACFRIIRYIDSADFEKNFGPPIKAGAKPHFIFKNDYAEDVAKLPYDSEKCRIIVNFLLACEQQINQFIPSGTKRIAFGEAVYVHNEFKSHGLGKVISQLCEDLARSNGCEFIGSVAVAKNSSNIAFRKNLKCIFAFPYHKYIVNGKIVFKDLVDGATECNVFLGKL